MKTEELKIKYPAGFEHAVHMTREEMEPSQLYVDVRKAAREAG